MKKCLRAGLQTIGLEDVQCTEVSMKVLAYTSSQIPLRKRQKVQGGTKMDVDQPAWIFGLRDRKLSHYFQAFINRVSTVCQASEKGIPMLELM